MRSRLVPRILTALTIVVLAGTAVEANRQAKARKLMRQAERSLSAGQVVAAHEQLTEAVRLDPDAVDAHVRLGHMAMQAKDWNGAIDHYESAKLAGARLIDARRQSEFGRSNRRQELIRAYQDELNFVAGPSYKGRDQQRKIAELEKKIRDLENPNQTVFDDSYSMPPELPFFLGNALFQAERLEEALGQYELALSSDPEFGQAHVNAAILYHRQGQHDVAWRHVHQAQDAGVTPAAGFIAELRESAPEPRR